MGKSVGPKSKRERERERERERGINIWFRIRGIGWLRKNGGVEA